MTSISSTNPSSELAQSKFRLINSLRWLLPTQFDFLFALCCLLVAIGLLDPLLEQQLVQNGMYYKFGIGKLGFALGLYAACLTAVAVAWGWRKLRIQTGIMFSIACLAGLIVFLWSIGEVTCVWTIGYGPYRTATPEGSRMLIEDSAFEFGLKAVGISIVVFTALFLLTRGFLWLLNRMKTGGKTNAKVPRVKLMIGFALLLFIAKALQDLFFPMGYFYALHGLVTESLLSSVGVALFGFFACLIIPGWMLTRGVKIRWKILMLIVLLGLVVVFCIVRNNVVQPRLSEKVILVVNAIALMSYYVLLVLVSGNSPTQETSPRKFSIWTMLPLVLLVGFAGAVYSLDVTTLVGTSYSSWPNLKWELARESKRLARKTDYRIGVMTESGLPCVVGTLDKSMPFDVFDGLKGHQISIVSLSGLTPKFDISSLYGATRLLLDDSMVSSEQLQGLAGSAWYVSLADTGVVDPDGSVRLSTAANFHLNDKTGERLGSLVDSIGSIAAPWVLVGYELQSDNQNLLAILRLSKKTAVYLSHQSLDAFVKQGGFEGKDLSNVVVELNENSFEGCDNILESELFQFILNTNVLVTFYIESVDDLFWDLVFAKNQEAAVDFWPGENELIEILGEADRKHLRFGKQQDEIQKLFLPAGGYSYGVTNRFEGLKEVEVLSLDPMWVCPESPRKRYSRSRGFIPPARGIVLDGIEKLTKIRRLDLNPNAAIADTDLLTKIPTVEHLQVRFDQSVVPAIDFSVVKNLKTLIYFGVPTKNMIADLGTLSKLKTLKLIYLESDMLSEKEKQNLVKSIPGVNVELVRYEDYAPMPPAEFVEHVKQRSAEIRSRWGVQPQH